MIWVIVVILFFIFWGTMMLQDVEKSLAQAEAELQKELNEPTLTPVVFCSQCDNVNPILKDEFCTQCGTKS